MESSDARRLKELEGENSKLKKLLRRRCSITRRSKWWLGENGEPAGASERQSRRCVRAAGV